MLQEIGHEEAIVFNEIDLSIVDETRSQLNYEGQRRYDMYATKIDDNLTSHCKESRKKRLFSSLETSSDSNNSEPVYHSKKRQNKGHPPYKSALQAS